MNLVSDSYLSEITSITMGNSIGKGEPGDEDQKQRTIYTTDAGIITFFPYVCGV